MSLEIAHYLRHLATRCSRLSRDTGDAVLSEELVIISVKLVEKAQRSKPNMRCCIGADPKASPPDVVPTDCKD
jgi:hypothetical protein